MWFEKKKCQFPRFPSFRFCPILEIENLETSEIFRLLQIFIALVTRLKPFIASQINVSRQIKKDTVYKKACFLHCFMHACFFPKKFFKKDRRFSIDTSQHKYTFLRYGNILNTLE